MTQVKNFYAVAIRNQRDFDGKPTQTFNINGKTIKTNFGAYDYPYWSGNNSDIPKKYTHVERLGFRQSANDIINSLILAGYDEIRVVLVASGQIHGYCEEYFWACKSQNAQNEPETAPETETKEIIQTEPEKVTECKSQPVRRLCGAPRLIDDQESIKDLARMYHIEECYDKASDSIKFADDYFEAIDIFVIDLLKNEHDFRLRCDAERVWHLERV